MSHRVAVAVIVLVAFLVLTPLAIIVWMSFVPDVPTLRGPYTLSNFAVLGDKTTYELLLNSVVFSVLTVIIALFFGLPIAWLVERTDLPHKLLIRSLIGMTILIPTFLLAMGWILLLSPTIGLINQFLTRTVVLPFTLNIYTMAGMAFIQGVSFMPIAFFMLTAVFAKMDPAMEEAAYANRVPGWRTLLRITLPLSWPGLLAAIVYMFMLGIAVLEVPLIVGLPGQIHLFSSRVFILTRGSSAVPQYGIVGATSVIFIAFSMVAAYYYSKVIQKSYRYAVVSGKGYRPRTVELGPWKWLAGGFVCVYFLLSIGLPYLSLIWVSLIPYIQVPSMTAFESVSFSAYRYLTNPMVREALTNTAILIFSAPTLVMILSILVSWIIVRSNMRGRLTLDRLATIPLAIPNLIIGVALIYIALIAGPFFPVYGTVWILVVAFVISHITFGTRTLNAAMIQIHKDLEEAAAVSGAPPSRVIRRIIVPLIKAPLLDGWIWLFLLSFREVTMAITLYITDNAVLSTVVWVLWSNGQFDRAAAVSVVLALLMGFLALLARIVGIQIGGRSTVKA